MIRRALINRLLNRSGQITKMHSVDLSTRRVEKVARPVKEAVPKETARLEVPWKYMGLQQDILKA